MKVCFLILVLALTFQQSFSLYGSNSKVVSLTQGNFDSKVKRGKGIWFVEFYAPWCGHCKSLAPEYEKVAKALDGMVGVGAVDMTTDQAAGAAYDIKGFPTIKFFGDNGSVVDYNGGRDAKSMMNFALDQVKKTAETRLQGKSSGNSQSKGNSSGGKSSKGSGSAGSVVALTDDDFDELLMKSEDVWFVKFYAPWCGHCKSLAPTWEELAGSVPGAKIAKIDCTVNTKVCQRFGVQGYPSLKLFPGGKKSDSSAQDYNGGRDSGSLSAFVSSEVKKSQPLRFEQLTDQENFTKFCGEQQRGVCLIAFLPHIYDSSAVERNKYITMIQSAAEKYKAQPVSFLWSQGGDQYEFEEKFALGGGYPSILALSLSKNASTIMRKSFTTENVSSFISGLIAGQEKIQPIRGKIPTISKATKWDGKDQKPQSKEEL